MTQTAQLGLPAEDVAAAFEHSITWEDDIWRADPVDVEQVHASARAKFFDLLVSVVENRDAPSQSSAARVLLFHGQSGAGKTHLIRALRTASHKRELAYFGYAQLTPDVGNYADYYLKRLLNSLEKSYDPSGEEAESGLARMTRKLVADCSTITDDDIEALADGDFSELALAELVHDLADRIIAAPRFAGRDLDVNIIRALLYLQRRDPRIDQRIRQYLQGRQLNALSQASVAALDPNSGDGRAFEIIESLGRVMAVVDDAALVFCIDQVEDLRFFDDAEDRFQRAVRDLIQIANRLPTAIVVISCLEDFYGHVRGVVAQSYIDRIEKTGPVSLRERRTAEEARLIIAKRLREKLMADGVLSGDPDPTAVFGPNFVEEFGGLSTRRLLEHAQNWLRGTVEPAASSFGGTSDATVAPVKLDAATDQPTQSLISTLAAALGFGADQNSSGKIASPPAALSSAISGRSDNLAPVGNQPQPIAAAPAPDLAAPTGLPPVAANADALTGVRATEERKPDGIDWREMWERFATAYEAELTDDDGSLIDAIAASLSLAATEWGDAVSADVTVVEDLDQELPALDMTVTHSTGHTFEGRVFLCNRPTQGGGFKRQIEKVLPNMDGRTCFMVRASEFPPSKKNQAAQVFRKYREAGGRHMMIAIPEWDRMVTAREFHLHHQGDPGFAEWFADAKLVSGLTPIAQMLRLDLMGQALPPLVATTASGGGRRLRDAQPNLSLVSSAPNPTEFGAPTTHATPLSSVGEPRAWDQDLGDELPVAEQQVMDEVLAPAEPEPGSIEVGTYRYADGEIHLPQPIMKRHCAVLGGSGSGKTTLALTIIEQLLLEGIPAILIDRKGDLCSYANPDVWKEISGEDVERSAERERLAAHADVAVY
ncbi:MAG: helicase HerA-like domain-containing protein, partial [Pseudomonadota bacterium]